MLDDYFMANPGVKDLPKLGIECQSLNPQSVIIAMSHNSPLFYAKHQQLSVRLVFSLTLTFL